MTKSWNLKLLCATAFLAALTGAASAQAAGGDAPPATIGDAGPDQAAPLSEDELEILVARIALYPDELVALITAASLYPLQIVESGRFLASRVNDPSLEPKAAWGGSVISLLNYPEIVTMMSDDLDWTQTLGEAITYQQKDVLIAIQQLRDQAVVQGVIQSDDKVTVVNEGDNIVIQSTSPETVYVPQYSPEMLYVAGYPPAPIVYYPDPYPSYYYPTAPFFAGFITGAVWGAVVDWDDWGVWGGDWDNDVDIDIDCNKCFNDIDFDGNINFNDVDWKNVDRNKISFDKNQIKKIDKSNIKGSIKANDNNSIRAKATDIKKERPTTLPGKTGKVTDVRTSTLEGLKQKPAPKDLSRPTAKTKATPTARPNNPKPTKFDRPVGKPKVAAKADSRPKTPSGLGDVGKGKKTKVNAKRGGKSSNQLVLPKPKGGGKRGR
jgi:hypothetical protein